MTHLNLDKFRIEIAVLRQVVSPVYCRILGWHCRPVIGVWNGQRVAVIFFIFFIHFFRRMEWTESWS